MFGADAGVGETGGDRVSLGDLAVVVLQQEGAIAMQDAGCAARKRRRMLLVEAVARRFDPEHPHIGVVEERVEQSDRV